MTENDPSPLATSCTYPNPHSGKAGQLDNSSAYRPMKFNHLASMELRKSQGSRGTKRPRMSLNTAPSPGAWAWRFAPGVTGAPDASCMGVAPELWRVVREWCS